METYRSLDFCSVQKVFSTQITVHGPDSWLRNLLEMQNLRPQPILAELEPSFYQAPQVICIHIQDKKSYSRSFISSYILHMTWSVCTWSLCHKLISCKSLLKSQCQIPWVQLNHIWSTSLEPQLELIVWDNA